MYCKLQKRNNGILIPRPEKLMATASATNTKVNWKPVKNLYLKLDGSRAMNSKFCI